MKRAISAIAAVCFTAITAGSAQAVDDVMVVFDGSNSMWGQIDGTAKIEIARDAMESLMGDWTDKTNLGLMAYGHRREGDCTDIETLIAPGRVDRAAFLSRVRAIVPRGKTPLTSAIEQAAEELAYRDNPATVVVISDGIESCNRNPCALADKLERSGIGFTAHVIGFGLGSAEEQASLACIAERTGGRFIAAGNAGELNEALGEVSSAVASAPEPEPEPEPAEVGVMAPETATVGSNVDVSWSETLAGRDIVTIVPKGAEDREVENHLRVRDATSGSLRVPAEPGLYEVRYVRDEGRTVAGRATLEAVEAEVAVTAPETAVVGSSVPVSWGSAVAGRDMVTIVPAGAKEGTVENHLRVREASEGTLRAPSKPGLYEVRYVLDEGRRTLATAPVELTEAQATVSAPETAVVGSSVPVSWGSAVAGRDMVTIVPAGAKEGTVENHLRVREASEGTLRAPSKPGLYEVRYVLDEGRRTLATAPVELTEAQATVSAPETAIVGSSVPVSWGNAVAGRDMVTIVPAGAKEGTVENHLRVREASEGTLRAPSKPGLYEVRYVLDEGRRTLASAGIELTEPSISLTATETVRAKGDIEVRWDGEAPSGRDIVTIVPAGTAEREVKTHKRVRDHDAVTLKAPEETGLYEVRYVLDEGRRTLARTTVEVVAETAPLDTGGSLDVPERAAPGETVEVSWTSSSTSGRQRVALAESNQADFTWIEAKAAGDGPPLSFTMPDKPGFYEVRLLDLAGPKVLSRAMIEVR
ncbi:VWA domain-containing protein [Kaustia mangrovi]|uniref:VWA domain-containing protein n=1 Tax=Kaustia mangrovi TaxID=2593653 RepID=A0A7S8C3X7_9HYPH|nr:vWA domain-containing protein [Kaustia mangrovi]QPC42938.1 VWA domain-containing protein [Kaustia mangrovi]